MREFADLLSNLVIATDGLFAAAIGGIDGLLIESFNSSAKVNLEGAVAEHAALLKSIRNSYGVAMGSGDVEEWLVLTGDLTAHVKPVTSDYFLLSIGGKDVNLGRLRLNAARTIKDLKEVLT